MLFCRTSLALSMQTASPIPDRGAIHLVENDLGRSDNSTRDESLNSGGIADTIRAKRTPSVIPTDPWFFADLPA
jgi:hypothetical protein